jgi:NAD(P)-dependent dehydrogenase (short-subunit alcohol dehydrogenase family)
MTVNLKTMVLAAKAVIPRMMQTGGGSIINISSTAGLVGSPRSAAYNASKGAVRLFTKATAIQYGREGIRANSIHPGPIDTAMIHGIWQGDERSREESIARTALGRVGTVEDIAYGAMFLASDESSFMTGSELVMDGGITAQ